MNLLTKIGPKANLQELHLRLKVPLSTLLLSASLLSSFHIKDVWPVSITLIIFSCVGPFQVLNEKNDIYYIPMPKNQLRKKAYVSLH